MAGAEFVVDSDVIIPMFIHIGQELVAVGRLPIVIPEMVWSEVSKGKVGPDRAAFMTTIAGAPTAWDASSAEHVAFLRLFSGVEAKLGDGERSAIAYAYVQGRAVFVTADQLALKRSIEHLPGRVLSTFGLLQSLVSSGNIGKAVLDTFAKKYAASGLGREHPLPLWI